MLVLVTGLPGTGKTTFSRALAQKIGALHLNTDIIRDALNLRGRYDENTKENIYKVMLSRAEEALQGGRRVIVDGTFYRKSLREHFINLAARLKKPIFWINIKAQESSILDRVSKKREYSEADYQVYLKVKEKYEALEQECLTLWSDGPKKLEVLLEEAVDYLKDSTDGDS